MIEKYEDVMLMMSCEEGKGRPQYEKNGFLVNLAWSIQHAGLSKTLVDIFNDASKNYKQDESERCAELTQVGPENIEPPSTSLVKSVGCKEIMFPKNMNKPRDSVTSSDSEGTYDINVN